MQEGRTKLVLALIWRLILHFDINVLAEQLAAAGVTTKGGSSQRDLFFASRSLTTRFSPSRAAGTGSASKALLDWLRTQVHAYDDVAVKDFSKRFRRCSFKVAAHLNAQLYRRLCALRLGALAQAV